MKKLSSKLKKSLKSLRQETKEASKTLNEISHSTNNAIPQNQSQKTIKVSHPNWQIDTINTITHESNNKAKKEVVELVFIANLEELFSDALNTKHSKSHQLLAAIESQQSQEVREIIQNALMPQVYGAIKDNKSPQHPADTMSLQLQDNQVHINYAGAINARLKNITLDETTFHNNVMVDPQLILINKPFKVSYHWQQASITVKTDLSFSTIH